MPHLTQETTQESDKNERKYHVKRVKRSALSQQVTTRLQGADKTAKLTWNSNNKNDPQKKHHLGIVSKKLEGPKMFDSANFTLNSEMNQDK